MNINRDTVIDLHPAYLNGSVSESTREIVENFLEDDPKLQLLVERIEQEPQRPTVPPNQAKPSIHVNDTRFKRLMFQHNLFLGLAILSSLSFLVLLSGTFREIIELFLTAEAQRPQRFFLEYLLAFDGLGTVELFLSALFWILYRYAYGKLNTYNKLDKMRE